MHPMMVPPGAGLMPPVMPMPLPTAAVPKSTDIYIGKIANTIEDETIKVSPLDARHLAIEPLAPGVESVGGVWRGQIMETG